MKNKFWMAIFKLEPPICTCGRKMNVLEVIRCQKIYLILKATDDATDTGFYIFYSIKNMKTLGQVYSRKPSSKIALSVIDKYERGIL